MTNNKRIPRLLKTTAFFFCCLGTQAHAIQATGLSTKQQARLAPNLALTESIDCYGYQDNGMQEIRTSLSASYAAGANSPIQTAARIKTKVIVDAYTNNTLITYHGADNNDTTTNVYDALGRVIEIEQQQQEKSHAKPIITTVSYTLQASGSKIIHRELNTDGSVYYSKTHYYTPVGENSKTTDSLHGDAQPLVTRQFNDLGQLASSRDLQGDSDTPYYDAQGRTIRDKKIAVLGSGATRTITQHTTYDDVNARISDWKEGELKTAIGDSDKDKTATHIKQLDDENQWLSDTVTGQGNLLRGQGATSATEVDSAVHDNFGNITQKSHDSDSQTDLNDRHNADPLVTNLTYNAEGELTNVAMLARNNKQHPGDQKLTISNSYDLNQNLTRKIVNKVQNYRYFYDANNAPLAEYRCTASGCEQHIDKTYDYSQGAGQGYTVVVSNWSGEKNHQQTLRYQDINGAKKLIEKDTPDAVYTYTYGDVYQDKPTQVTKKVAGRITSQINYRYRPDGLLLQKTTARQQQGQLQRLGHPITYTYYSTKATDSDCQVAADDNNIDNVCKKTDAAGLVTHYVYQGNNTQITISSIINDKAIPLAGLSKTYGALGEILQQEHDDYPQADDKHKIDTIKYSYNDNFKRLSEIDFDNPQTADGGEQVTKIRYTYQDKRGNNTDDIMEKTQFSPSTGQTMVTDYTYSNSGQLLTSTKTTQDIQGVAKDVVKRQYAYQNQDNPTQVWVNETNGIEQAEPKEFDYQYNTLDQLTDVTSPDRSAVIDYQNGNMQNDELGNHYGYDEENHETSFTNVAGVTTRYTYNANGLRDGKSQDNSQRLGDKTTLRYVYDGDRVSGMLETRGKDQGDKVGYLSDGGQVQARIVVDRDNNRQRVQFLQHDQRGSTVNLLSRKNNGEVTDATYHYGDNGALTHTTADTSTQLDIFYNDEQFGYQHDQETGVQGTDYKMARTVHDFVGQVTRFISMDYGMKLRNLYEFAHNNTNENSDRGGHVALAVLGQQVLGFSLCGAAIGAAIGFGANLLINQENTKWKEAGEYAGVGAAIGAAIGAFLRGVSGVCASAVEEGGLLENLVGDCNNIDADGNFGYVSGSDDEEQVSAADEQANAVEKRANAAEERANAAEERANAAEKRANAAEERAATLSAKNKELQKQLTRQTMQNDENFQISRGKGIALKNYKSYLRLTGYRRADINYIGEYGCPPPKNSESTVFQLVSK